MSTSIQAQFPTYGPGGSGIFSGARPARLRACLAAGCVTALGLGAWLGQPAVLLAADPELARLLRGMALIKAALVMLALAAVTWRFGRPVSLRVAAAYLVGCWLLVSASILVWQLSYIAAAAIGFHAGEIGMLLVAWRDHGDSALFESKP